MAKKREKFSFKSLLEQFMQKSLQSLISVVSSNADHLIEWIKVIPVIKRKIRKLLTEFVLLAAGLAVMGMGLGIYLASKIPQLADGISHMFVGLALVLAAIIYAKLAK